MADGLRTAVLAGSMLTLLALLVERPSQSWEGQVSQQPFSPSEVRLVQAKGVGQKIGTKTVDYVDRYQLALIDGSGKEQTEVRMEFVTDSGRDLDGLRVQWNGAKNGQYPRGLTSVACYRGDEPVEIGKGMNAVLQFSKGESGDYRLQIDVKAEGTRLRGTTEAKLVGAIDASAARV